MKSRVYGSWLTEDHERWMSVNLLLQSKDLHSRIGVAIHRINSISKSIEELLDREFQPQLRGVD